MTLTRVSSAAVISLSLAVTTALSGLAAARADNVAAESSGGSHHVHDDQFLRVYEEAKRALKERRYEAARGFVKVALKEAQSPGERSRRMLEASLLLATIDVRTAEPHKAYNILKDLDRDMVKVFGKDSLERASELSELAETEVSLFKFKLAEQHAADALEILNKLSQQTEVGGRAEYANERGLAECRLGEALSSQGFHEEAKPHFANAHELLSLSPGIKDQDLADELRVEAIFLRGIGHKQEASNLFEKSCMLQDQAANPEQPQHLIGTVKMRWEAGSPHCHEIIDNDFPLRYITTNKLRVAATTVDLWELMAVIVSVTNLDDHRRIAGFGDIKLYKIESNNQTGQVKQVTLIPTVDHHIIDRTRRELTIWSLTQDRPWLANMQKNRNARGLVPKEGHDLFRGPNMFGVWCEWGGMSHTVPTKVSVLPSRENVFSHEETDDLNHESGLIRNEGSKQAGLMPIALEPYESRTGELFYIYPRGEDTVNVQVNIGNIIFEFPFQCRKQRIR
jgi:tetratricopeptide (TPR) repeat protein